MLKMQIVEDVKIVRETLLLRVDWPSLGVHVTGASEDGQKALELIERDVPDIVITDIAMPVLGGIELIQRIRSAYPHIKCIILSGLSEFKYAHEAIKLHVVDYVLKPIDIEELSQVVRKAVAEIKDERAKREELSKAKEMVKEKFPHRIEENMMELYGNMKNNKIVERIMAYIMTHIASKAISLQDIADQVSLSEKYVNFIFKETCGMTINHYIIARKMELAAELLRDFDVKIYEVCDRIGYSDQDYFRQCFKKHHGVTPSEYRNRYL